MRIIITDHAKDSLRERLGCSEAKFQKIAEKAWKATDSIGKGEIANTKFYEELFGDSTVYRKLMGAIYVFRQEASAAVLVTMYPPSKKAGKSTRPPKIISH